MTPSPEASVAKPPVRRASRRRRRQFALLIVAFLLVMQELLLRVFFPMPEVEGYNRVRYTNLRPGVAADAAKKRGLANVLIRYESELDGFFYDHRLNIYGFRGKDFAIDPTPGRKRVLFVGDSFTEGFGGSDDDTVPVHFERMLAQESVEAINLGVGATNLQQYLLAARDGVPLLRPQAVFVLIFANDFPVPALPLRESTPPEFPRYNPLLPRVVQIGGRLKAGYGLPRRFVTGPHPFYQPLSATAPDADWAKVPNVDPEVYSSVERGTFSYQLLGSPEHFALWMSDDYSKKGGAQDHLKRMAQLCSEHQCRLFVVYIPHHVTANAIYIPAQNRLGGKGFPRGEDMASPRYRTQQIHLTQVCKEQGLPFVDTTDAFVEAEKTQRMFWPMDGHCNPEGYRFLAEQCVQLWRETPSRGD